MNLIFLRSLEGTGLLVKGLSLKGTNLRDYIREANRFLKVG
jgi:hypothetical protein